MNTPVSTKHIRAGVTSTHGVFTARFAAEHLLAEVISDPRKNDPLVPSYIAALCMGIEGQINSILIEHFFDVVGSKYKEIAKPLLFLNVRDRFSIAVLLASDYCYELNHKNERVIQLFQLFDLRNRVVHVKQHRKIGTLVKNQQSSSLTIDNPDPSDPYGPEHQWKVDVKQLRSWLRLFNYWIPRLSFLGTNIKNTRFNPGTDFLPIVHELATHRRRLRARSANRRLQPTRGRRPARD